MNNPRLAEEFRSYWNCWLDNEESEAQLRLYSMPIVEEFRRAVQDLNWSKAERLQECYSYISDHCTHEPLLTAYELGQMHILLVMADFFALDGQWDAARANLDEVEAALRVGDERREKLGMTPRGNSEVRLDCMAIRATILLGDEKTEDVQAEIEPLVNEFERIADKFVAGVLADARDDEQYIETMLQAVATWELDVIKLCWKYDQSLAASLIEKFNARVGPHLEVLLRHYEQLNPKENRSAWYWDFELSKLLIETSDDPAGIKYCARERKFAARLTFGAGPLRAYELKWARELRRYKR